MASFKCTSKTIGTCNRALSWNTSQGVESSPLPENRRTWGRNWAQHSTCSPHFWAGRCVLLHSGLVTSVYLHDRETHASPVRTPPRILLPPLENLGLSCQGPATQTAPSGQGRNSERSRRVKESKYTFFLNIVKVNYMGRYWPRPLEATSVAMRIGALPYLNSEITKRN